MHRRPILLTITLLLSAATTAAPISQRIDDSLTCMAASEPLFNAVIALDVEDARLAADRLEMQAANETLPLYGMPILLKDNIETANLPTTAGSLLLANNRTGRDAPLVTRLKAAGAVILGKTNLSEWANFRSEHSSSGWSGVGGQTRNAVDPSRSPCGSSSGSAVAVARGYVPMAVGTETSGSIVCPAAVNGVVGFKPTQGLVSGEGIVPLASTQDTAGPIANSVTTAALTLATMSNPSTPRAAAVRTGLLNANALSSLAGLRIGVWAPSMGFDARRDQQLERVLATLRADGAEVIEGLSIERYPGFGDDSYKVLLYEFRRDINTYLAGLTGVDQPKSLKALIAGNKQLRSSELQVFDQSIFLKALALDDTEAMYLERLARIRQATRDEGLDRLFDDYALDAIVGISGSPAWLIDPINGDSFFGPGMAGNAAIAGNPHITLPLAQIGGLPIGISLYGERWRDDALAQIAHRLEARHPKPTYHWVAGTPATMHPSCASNAD